MTMIQFTYDDGENSATVSWSPEYGFIAAGNRGILGRIIFEATEPRVVEVPILDLPPLNEEQYRKIGSDSESHPRCFACGHAWHDGECEVVRDGLECGCQAAVP